MAERMRELRVPDDLDDDVTGSVMSEQQTEGKDPASVSGRWTGLYRKRGTRWHLVSVFACRREAYHYFHTLNDGSDYRLAPLRGTLRTVSLLS